MKTAVNFFDVLIIENKPKINKPKLLFRSALTFVFLANITLIMVCLFLNGQLEENERRHMDRLDTPLFVEKNDYDLFLKQFINSTRKGLKNTRLLEEHAHDIKGFKTAYFAAVEQVKPANITIKSMSFSDKRLTVSCYAQSGSPAADFTLALENTGVFSEVSYRGFTSGTTEGDISFAIVCTVKEDI